MARGNDYTYVAGGNNILSSTLHWGTSSTDDGWPLTSRNFTALHSTWPSKFHTFGLEWSKKYIFIYIDSRLLEVVYTGFTTDLWTLGGFTISDGDDSYVDGINPWRNSPNKNAPFDQEFYLTLEVVVGGTSGWFVDSKDGKPWSDGSETAAYEFWTGRDQWYPTWQTAGAGEMEVKRVRMWQECNDADQCEAGD